MHHRCVHRGGQGVCLQGAVRWSLSRSGICFQGYAYRRLLHPGGGQIPSGSAYRGVCLHGRQTPPPEIHGILQDTVNKRAVRILLECILAFNWVKLKEIGLGDLYILTFFKEVTLNWEQIGSRRREEGFILFDWTEMKCHIVNITDAIGFVWLPLVVFVSTWPIFTCSRCVANTGGHEVALHRLVQDKMSQYYWIERQCAVGFVTPVNIYSSAYF